MKPHPQTYRRLLAGALYLVRAHVADCLEKRLIPGPDFKLATWKRLLDVVDECLTEVDP